jgi:DNA primase
MAIPDEEVAQVRAATDIVALIGEHTALKRVGRRFVGLCPFHGEKTASFSVNAEEGLYYCFGCQVSGDAISFIRAVEGCDFVEAVERLAGRAGIAIHIEDDPQAGLERGRRQQIYEAMTGAVAFYHERLVNGKDARSARQYLRARGYDGDIVRHFQLGFAPNSFDALSKTSASPKGVLRDAGLAYDGSRGQLQDAFRERVIFPIFDAAGRAIALGGRILPEDLRKDTRDPGPKYRNSPETSIYQKRRTLYGLNWAKTEISHAGEAIVCEGYTDVIGFHLAGIDRAVATCGTALTEDHFRLLARFAKRIVLAFDADAAGENAAARLYEWERRHELELFVASLPQGSDPGELAGTQPGALREAIENARPFLAFRIDRAFGTDELASPEARSRTADAAIAVVAEHPDNLVRDEYLTVIADRTRFDPDDLRARLEQAHQAVLRGEKPASAQRPQQSTPRDVALRDAPIVREDGRDELGNAPTSTRARQPNELRAGRDALWLAIQRPRDVAGRFDELLFVDPVQKRAYLALSDASELHEAIGAADPEAADLLIKLAVSELPADADVDGTLVALVRNAAQRMNRSLNAKARQAADKGDSEALSEREAEIRWLKAELELLGDTLVQVGHPSPAIDAADRLVAWLRQQVLEG